MVNKSDAVDKMNVGLEHREETGFESGLKLHESSPDLIQADSASDGPCTLTRYAHG